MVKNTNLSRLAETNFSGFNLRDAYIADNAEYIAALRDEALFSNWGTKVLVRIPLTDNFEDTENFVDEYSNFVNIEWKDTVESVIPKFSEYRQNVSDEGMSADGTDGIYPLEVIIPTKLHLPRNSRIVFNEYDSNEHKIAREWVVLGTVMKQLSDSKTYSRVANCSPARKSSFDNIETTLHTIWFDWYCNNLNKKTNIKAQGIIWFEHCLLPLGSVKKVIRLDDLYEELTNDSEYCEYISTLMYYDSRSKHIIKSRPYFELNEEYEVYDENNKVINIIKNVEGEKIPLKLIATGIDEDHNLTSFKYNIEQGYTIFGKNGSLTGYIKKDDLSIGEIELISIDRFSDTYQEDIDNLKALKPKYLTPYRLDIVFSAKKLAISVLN